MGLAPGALKLLLREATRQPFGGRVLTLGRQDVHFTRAQLEGVASEMGVVLHATANALAAKQHFASRGFIDDQTLFTALGSSEVEALDYSDFEGADHVFDLNASEVPESLRGRFDVVVDAGTLEHVFHIPHALANVFQMLRDGGRVVHLAPSCNHLDHGFWMFSPTVFADFYGANGWDVHTLQLFRYTHLAAVDPWLVFEHRDPVLPQLAMGGFDSARYGVCCIATKVIGATGDRVPQQSAYAPVWNGVTSNRIAASSYPRLVARLEGHPRLDALLRRAWGARRRLRRHRGLTVVDRF